jgi:hypothetical protein
LLGQVQGDLPLDAQPEPSDLAEPTAAAAEPAEAIALDAASPVETATEPPVIHPTDASERAE